MSHLSLRLTTTVIAQPVQTVFVVWNNYNFLKSLFATIWSWFTATLEPVSKTNKTRRVWERPTTAECVRVCTCVHLANVLYICKLQILHLYRTFSNALELCFRGCSVVWRGLMKIIENFGHGKKRHLLTCFHCLYFCSFHRWADLDMGFKPPSGIQAFRPWPCVILHNIPPSNFLAFVSRTSSPSTTHTSFLCVCVYAGIPISQIPWLQLFCANSTSQRKYILRVWEGYRHQPIKQPYRLFVNPLLQPIFMVYC